MFLFIIFELLLWAALISAMLFGGRDERLAVLVLAAAFTATPFVARSFWDPFRQLEVGILGVSCTSFVLLLALALRSDKYWPLWLTAMQGQAVIAHLAPLVRTGISAWAYQTANSTWGYLQLILVLVATWHHRRYWRTPSASKRWRPFWVP